MLPFLADLISRTPPEKLIERLMHTAYDELMVIDLANDRFESRYHTDGKFFTPVIDNYYTSLVEYTSSHMVHPEDRETHYALMNPVGMEARLASADPKGILSGSIRYLALDGNWRQMETLRQQALLQFRSGSSMHPPVPLWLRLLRIRLRPGQQAQMPGIAVTMGQAARLAR